MLWIIIKGKKTKPRVHKARVMGKDPDVGVDLDFPKNIDENFADGKKKGKSRNYR